MRGAGVGGEDYGQWDTLIPNLDPQSLTLDAPLPQHSLFPEKMVSSCLDAPTGLSHEDLIQVRKLTSSRFPWGVSPLLLGP